MEAGGQLAGELISRSRLNLNPFDPGYSSTAASRMSAMTQIKITPEVFFKTGWLTQNS
jgi:hypothetical protein